MGLKSFSKQQMMIYSSYIQETNKNALNFYFQLHNIQKDPKNITITPETRAWNNHARFETTEVQLYSIIAERYRNMALKTLLLSSYNLTFHK